METGNFLMPLSEFERRAECIAIDGSYIYLRHALPRTDRLFERSAQSVRAVLIRFEDVSVGIAIDPKPDVLDRTLAELI